MDVVLTVNLLGWAGAGLLLFAYALVSSKKCEGNSVVYQCLNMAGSALLIVNSMYFRAYPSTFVNAVWIAIACFSIAGKRRSPRDQ